MEKRFDCIKLHFTSPLHLSRGRETYDESAQVLHSDSLTAALFVAALRLGTSDTDALAMLDGCRLSSAYPFSGEEFFFPKPLVRLPFSLKDDQTAKQGKTFKNVRFFGKSWFEKLIHAEESVIDPDVHLFNKAYLSDSRIRTVVASSVNQRVTIPPDYSENATPFYTERLFFGEQAGLFALVEWTDPAVKEIFYQSLRLLGDLGIGTDRAVGNGFFESETVQLSLRLPENNTHQTNLGLYLPDEQDLQSADYETSAWSLIKRGGYLAGASDPDHITLRKRSIYMFEAGSVFPVKTLTGKRIDLKPEYTGFDHPVWRDGRTVFLPIQKKADNDEN